MKPLKPNTQAQLDQINIEIRKKSRRWIYYNSRGNAPDSGWQRLRACDQVRELGSLHQALLHFQLTPPRNITPTCKESLYYDPQRPVSDNRA